MYLTACVGAALYPTHGETARDLLRNVDTALHHIKSRDRNAVQFYSPQLTASIGRWVQLEAGLRQAIENDEFTLNFQPKVDLATRCVIGAEALVRWGNEELGSVSPDEFVPVAEEAGLIGAIGNWVLQQACHHAVQWNRGGGQPIHVGVNFSAHQMRRPDIADKVKVCLEESGLDPRLLELELTESVMMDDTGKSIALLEDLRGLGITVAIDDFGTGYSSLSYLTDFPLDTLKVDRAFVMNLPDDRDAVTIARAIIGLAQNLDLHIVAEGIETDEHERFLQGLGCHTGQGYLFSRPLGAAEFNEFIAQNQTPMPVAG